MKIPLSVRCLACFDVFCCPSCRRIHEEKAHGIKYDCPICRGERLPCPSKFLHDQFLLDHVKQSHLPLHCGRCNQVFEDMDGLLNVGAECERDEVSKSGDFIKKGVDDRNDTLEKFDQLCEKSDNYSGKEVSFDEISSVTCNTFTPHKNLDSQGSEEASRSYTEQDNGNGKSKTSTPIVRNEVLSIGDRQKTPYVKKKLTRQMAADIDDTSEDSEDVNSSDDTKSSMDHGVTLEREQKFLDGEGNSNTPSRMVQPLTSACSATPAAMPLRRYVTTSTPTHPAAAAWTLFPSSGNDSPLSEIDSTTASPAADSTDNEVQTPTDSATATKTVTRPLKSIILVSGRTQDSGEKQVTFADDTESPGSELSSARSKKVKFADDTNFDRNKHFNRVFRKPRRFLTPGPSKFNKNPKNPRFQAIINRFESGATKQKVLTNNESDATDDATPNITNFNPNTPARAIVFSENENLTPETPLPVSISLVSPLDAKQMIAVMSPENEEDLFKSCIIESPAQDEEKKENSLQATISAFSNNVACSIQKSLNSALQTGVSESTKIQFNFIITKKTVTVQRIHDLKNDKIPKSDEVVSDEKVIVRNDGEGIWTSIRRAINNVIWGKTTDPENKDQIILKTPETDNVSLVSSDLSSGSKRKCSALTDLEQSPLNHKRCKHTYAGRIRGRRPIKHTLDRAASAGQHGFFKMLNEKKIERVNLNRSF